MFSDIELLNPHIMWYLYNYLVGLHMSTDGNMRGIKGLGSMCVWGSRWDMCC